MDSLRKLAHLPSHTKMAGAYPLPPVHRDQATQHPEEGAAMAEKQRTQPVLVDISRMTRGNCWLIQPCPSVLS